MTISTWLLFIGYVLQNINYERLPSFFSFRCKAPVLRSQNTPSVYP